MTSAANPSAAAAAIDRRDKQTDGRTDGQTLGCFMTLTAYYADRATIRQNIATGKQQLRRNKHIDVEIMN